MVLRCGCGGSAVSGDPIGTSLHDDERRGHRVEGVQREG